jgi:hypothetical protein
MDWNFNFCLKQKKRFEYCYKYCKKECPSVSNLWYRLIRNPIVNFFTAIRLKFVKCNQLPTQCSMLYRNKYCLFEGRHWSCQIDKNS